MTGLLHRLAARAAGRAVPVRSRLALSYGADALPGLAPRPAVVAEPPEADRRTAGDPERREAALRQGPRAAETEEGPARPPEQARPVDRAPPRPTGAPAQRETPSPDPTPAPQAAAERPTEARPAPGAAARAPAAPPALPGLRGAAPAAAREIRDESGAAPLGRVVEAAAAPEWRRPIPAPEVWADPPPLLPPAAEAAGAEPAARAAAADRTPPPPGRRTPPAHAAAHEVHVHIGRIEITAVRDAPPARPTARPPRTRSLDAYLAERDRR